MGHVLGLDNIMSWEIDPAYFAGQPPLMWYNINEGFDSNNPESYFMNPLQIDSLTLGTLSCIYDLDALRQAHPISF